MQTYATSHPIKQTALLFGRKAAKECFKNVHSRTFQRRTKEVREIEIKKRDERISFLFEAGHSIYAISKILNFHRRGCKKSLERQGMIVTKIDVEKTLYDFYVVDLPKRTKTAEILKAEKQYEESGKNLQKLIKKCEKEKADNSIFRKKYKQYKFQVEVRGCRASVNRLAELLNWSSAKTKKVAKRLRLSIFI